MIPAMEETTLTVFMDEEGNEVPKDRATRFVILTTDKTGQRVKEDFGEVGHGP